MKTDINSDIGKFVKIIPYKQLDDWISFVEKFVGKDEVSTSEFTQPEQALVQELQGAGLLIIRDPQYDEAQRGSTALPPRQDNKVQWNRSTVVLKCDPVVLVDKLKERKVNESDDLTLQAEG